jgi:hypothetical protein
VIITISLVSVVLFLLAFSLLRIVPVATGATKTALEAVSAMRDPSLDDEAREKTIQNFSISLFGSFFSILIRSIAALLTAAVPIYAADKLEFVVAADVTDFLSRWDIIIILTLVICTGWYIKSRL